MNKQEGVLKIDPEKKAEELIRAVQGAFKERGFSKAVLGLSGGLDSSTIAFLLAKALGGENVTALIMPYGPQDTADAEEMVRLLGIKAEKINISPMVDAYFSRYPDADKVRKGNKMARERMSILYDHSRRLDALVVGTSNRTELHLGYFTMHGDGACAIAPLASLYKTQVIQLAEYLGVPNKIIRKKPTAGLWEGQTDEDELGASYAEIDRVLYCLEGIKSVDEIVAEGHDRSVVELVLNRVEKYKFKMEGTLFL